MAQFTFNVSGVRSGDYKGKETDSARVTLQKVANFIQGLSGAAYGATSFTVSDDAASATITLSGVGGTAATGSYALSGVGGTAATGTITLGGGAGNPTVVINGVSVGPVAFNTDDDTTAADLATAINANGTLSPLLSALASGPDVGITVTAKGTTGNYTFTGSRTAGTISLTGSGFLTGGVNGSVGTTINGTLVTTNTTNLTDTAAATAVAAAIEANATLGPLLAAVGSTTNVNLTWGAKGTAGNAITLAAGTSATGTATRSGATFSGGAQGAVIVDVGPTPASESTDTTNLTDAAAATLLATEMNANADIAALVTNSASGAVVTVTARAAGTAGNTIALAATSDTGTATVSATPLSGGTQFSYNL